MLIHWKKINCKKIICDYNFGGWGQEEVIVCVSPKIFLNKNFGLTIDFGRCPGLGFRVPCLFYYFCYSNNVLKIWILHILRRMQSLCLSFFIFHGHLELGIQKIWFQSHLSHLNFFYPCSTPFPFRFWSKYKSF